MDSRWYATKKNEEICTLVSLITTISTYLPVKIFLTNKDLSHIMKFISKDEIDAIHPSKISIDQHEIFLDEKKEIINITLQ